jgi:hypothetical protein
MGFIESELITASIKLRQCWLEKIKVTEHASLSDWELETWN